jgi:hypothetical protein
MENVRNRINFKLLSNQDCGLNLRSHIKSFTIFNDNLVGVNMLKNEVILNKPIFIGQNVLDESKFIMADFHYNVMIKNLGRENIDLLFTDTDSLCYHIKNKNPYEFIKVNKDYFDLSAYPKNNELFDATNKKVIGKFKDECVDGHINYINEFVGLRSKLYAYQTEFNNDGEIIKGIDKNIHKRCKGVKKSVVSKYIRFNHYKDVLFNRGVKTVKQNNIRSYKHDLYTEEIKKVALSYNDDKTFVCDNNIDTYTFGHYKNRLN